MEIILVTEDNRDVLSRVAPDVFDHAIQSDLYDEFVRDPRHHLAVALDDRIVVGMASAVHYVHPDKAPQLFINEVGVTTTHRRRGIADALLKRLLELAKSYGCTEAWVLTDRGNEAAMRLYAGAGGTQAERDQVVSFPVKLTLHN